MARLYSNENFPFPAVEKLRGLGHDVLTVQETGKIGEPMTDEEVLAFAVRERRIVLTLNRRHFIRLHQERPKHAGIIVCKVNPDFAALAIQVHRAIGTKSSLAGQLVRVNRNA